jgi:hypothetical protein
LYSKNASDVAYWPEAAVRGNAAERQQSSVNRTLGGRGRDRTGNSKIRLVS